MKEHAGNRWVIAVAGVMQVALGAVYAWSVFRDPLVQAFGWSIPAVTLTFTIAILIGLGLGYIVPVATLVRWFPDRRGFITGLAVAGFGAGALVTAPVATGLIQTFGVMQTFAILGVVYLVLVVGAATFMRNPPEGYRPAGWQPPAVQAINRAGGEHTLGQALRTWQWYALWAVLFLNVTAGISIISQAAPMAMEITGVSALAAAGMVSII